jgi:hypothetical protein
VSQTGDADLSPVGVDLMLALQPWMEKLYIQNKDTLQIQRMSFEDDESEYAWCQRAVVQEVQRQYNLGLPVRIIILKARQLGISTVTAGIMYNWAFLHPGIRSLVIAHDTEASKNLFDKAKLMWEEWPFRSLYTESHNSQKTLGWEETRSSLRIATARNTGSGRSFTFHAVHASEAAFWEDPETLMTGLGQSVPYAHGSIIVIESTANGVGGWFHDQWQDAVLGKTVFKPIFFPWHKHKGYSFPTTTLTEMDYVKDERDLAKQFSLNPGQIAWRRHTIQNECMNDINKFHQEYPCTPEEAFLSTGHNAFPLMALEEAYKPMNTPRGFLYLVKGKYQFKKDPTMNLRIFQLPADDARWGQYVVAGDPSRTAFGDGACIQVINRRTLEQVAVWHGHIDPVPFADRMMELGWFYNSAVLNVEINGPGYATIGAILKSNYPNVWQHRWMDKSPGKVSTSYGWQMSYHRKHAATGLVIDFLGKKALTIHDRLTYEEMKNFVYLPAGELGPASPQGNDDSVTSYLIGIATAIYNDPPSYGDDPAPAYNDLFGEPPWEAFR